MATAPSIRALREATGISQSYASMILSNKREPSRALAIRILRSTGWRHASIADLSDSQMAVLEQVDPWVSRAAQAEQVAA